ncbi:ABC transporter substrate-binding protein [Rhodococcus sp. X156]|uniref:ABC transporter substrate-binding protein n=1 Tax=Rhodococcus sp. X156 TaxID=2499145 RepID=UPI0013E2DC7F|nr:ABC transporter substrate-binding protein [Rhodococcus sp. X156]
MSALLASALLVTACGSGDNASDSALEGPATASSLTIAVDKDSGPLNLFAGQTDQLTELVYDKLLAPSPYVDDPKPWLATSVTQVSASTWEVALRDGVTWHDGAPFTADDVVFSFHYMHQAPTGRFTHHVNDTPSISTVETTAAGGVRFTCDYACPELGPVTLADLPIVPKHVWSTVDPAKAKEHAALPIGTGPYQLVDYSPTSGYRFTANANYFAGKPTVDELVMPVIADPSATFTALRSGQIDATTRALTPELTDEFRRSSQVGVVKTSPLRYPELKLNFLEAPFSEAKFRTALNKAVDRDQLLEVVGLGQGRPATQGYVHPDAPYANPTESPYDVAGANTILDELGYVDDDGDGFRENAAGEKLTYRIHANGGLAPDVRAAQLLTEDFRKVGLDVSVVAVDTGSLSDIAAKKTYDMYVTTNSPHAVADPTQFIMSHRSGNLWKAPSVPYPEYDALYEKWRKTETNEARLAVLDEIQTLFNQQPTVLGLYYPDEYFGVRADSFAGWVETPGYGVVHKWSFLPREVSESAGAIAPVR